MVPLIMNNLYLFLTNWTSFFRREEEAQGNPPNPISPSSNQLYNKSKDSKTRVNKQKVAYGMIWYAGSMFGYFLMEKFHQGLQL
jgi:hypothetical protein